jgi:putative peptidoglycan lipid II flippase
VTGSKQREVDEGSQAAGGEAPGVTTNGERVIARQKGVAGRTIWISFLTLLSRLLGLLREIISAILFGDSSVVYDAFLFAWRIPNMFRRFLGEGALSTSLQAALTEADATAGEQSGRALFLATIRVLFRLLVVVCVVVMAAVWLLPDEMPGTDFRWLGPRPDLVREFTVRLMPFVIFVCLAAAVGGALNVRAHYSMPALGPVVLNVIWILALAGIAVLGSGDGAEGWEAQLPAMRWLAWGVLVGGLAQLALMVPALRRRGLLGPGLPRIAPKARRKAMGVLKRSAPLALGAAVYQVNVMIDGLMAQSLLPPGGQTVHYLANRVQQFPLALVAIAATTAVFPALAALGQQRRLADLRALHDKTQRGVLFVALPATIGLAVLALPVTSALFHYGNFGAVGVDRTAAALRVLAFAILPVGAVGLVARIYYSVGDFKTPVRISACMLVANALLNLLFVQRVGMDADGLALATSITSLGNLVFLLPGLRRRLELPRALPGFGQALTRMLVAASACGAVAYAGEAWLAGFVPGPVALLCAITAGVLTYLTTSRLLGVAEWAEFSSRIQGIWSKMAQKLRR